MEMCALSALDRSETSNVEERRPYIIDYIIFFIFVDELRAGVSRNRADRHKMKMSPVCRTELYLFEWSFSALNPLILSEQV